MVAQEKKVEEQDKQAGTAKNVNNLAAAKKLLDNAAKGLAQSTNEKTQFLNDLKTHIVVLLEKGFSCQQIYKLLTNEKVGFTGSYQTVRTVLTPWRVELGLEKKGAKKEAPVVRKASSVDPADKSTEALKNLHDKKLNIS